MNKKDVTTSTKAPRVDAANGSTTETPPLQLHPLLSAALDLFVRLGYHGTSVRGIAAEARMTVPGLYYNFANKQDILTELLTLRTRTSPAAPRQRWRRPGRIPVHASQRSSDAWSCT